MSDTRIDDLTRSLGEGDSSDDSSIEVVTREQNQKSAPTNIGRYQIVRLIGKGGFGKVYLALDDKLDRQVAVKVPHSRLLHCGEAISSYLSEPRTIARLDHPHIVPVYDVGGTDEFPCYFVSKFIDGSTLCRHIQSFNRQWHAIAELVATLAEALHYAHEQGVIHRDIKPGNVLIDKQWKPYLSDFGLALREPEQGQGPLYVGTPAYMSPEQARGEGHRVDRRSDVYSLGTVLYQLSCGRRTFYTKSKPKLLHQIATAEVEPLRQIDDQVPKELERICLRALSKRASERYPTASDFAEDLQHFLRDFESNPSTVAFSDHPSDEQDAVTGSGNFSTGRPHTSSSNWPAVIPRGLRCFEEEDADFFLGLLPGPRDRHGLPESIRFWKARIEQLDPAKTFSVGLLYGPSGCGKSSLARAGLLPRLASSVEPIYIEASPNDTEARILRALRRVLPKMPDDLSLAEAFRYVRQESPKKLVIFVDQFEQWLHSHSVSDDEPLVIAFRQCDGGRLQAITMLRDDFSMAAARFMAALDIPIAQGVNFSTVDLFDVNHAIRVLTSFGKAYGALPQRSRDMTSSQRRFIDSACRGLAEDGRVVSVRLALFAEMVKQKPWTSATLQEVGGTRGVGANFLEETLCSRHSNPTYSTHEKAARYVLARLLPEVGTDIRGNMRSRAELMTASGYQDDPKEFDELVRILDGELRIITPTDPEIDATAAGGSGNYYQLTHDYLVPSLRQWLSRKQSETRRGRAELSLREIHSIWSSTGNPKHLPSLYNWLNILIYSRRSDWSTSQHEMIRSASRRFLTKAAVLFLALATISWMFLDQRRSWRAKALVEQLSTSAPAKLPFILEELEPYSDRAETYLNVLLQEPPDSNAHLHASLARLSHDPSQLEYLLQRIGDVDLPTLSAMVSRLLPHHKELEEPLWELVASADASREERLRAAFALSAFSDAFNNRDSRWNKVASRLANDLLDHLFRSPDDYSRLVRGMRPVGPVFVEPLAETLRANDDNRQILAASLIGSLASDEPSLVAAQIPDTNPEQYGILLPVISEKPMPCIRVLRDFINSHEQRAEQNEDLMREQMRTATAAAALLRLQHDEVTYSLLQHRKDPSIRSALIHKFADYQVPISRLAQRLRVEQRPDVVQATMLALGQYPTSDFVGTLDGKAQTCVQARLESQEPGVRASAEWLLRQHGLEVSRLPAKVANERDLPDGVSLYRNLADHLMVVIDATDGSSIGRRFAVSDRETTIAQIKQFRSDYEPKWQAAPTPNCPANLMPWFHAAGYCNELTLRSGLGAEALCYEIDPVTGYAVERADCESRRGYRLLTSDEWTLACSAGSVTPYSFGRDPSLLNQYAWYERNSGGHLRPVGAKKPNVFGLFDFHGNALEWTNDVDPNGDDSRRTLRGGHCKHDAGSVVTLAEDVFPVNSYNYSVSFRVARTIPTKEQPHE